MATKEIFKLEDAARCRHVLLAGDAGYGRFVQAENISNFAQHQRAHGDFTMFEKLALAINDGLRYAVDGFKALLHVLDQPACFLQLAGQVAIATALAAENFGI